ncbi:hypothetical protein CEXT_351501 [Caerostris extrusa]|uniref:Uncharacterized protein n=1 Tax=Caerostris extrusa TaxID=172846 RepID=A0AAV4XNI0_CAEEX|nr:hypothetical protein CEXT_351501 [Caerostris extrusa]
MSCFPPVEMLESVAPDVSSIKNPPQTRQFCSNVLNYSFSGNEEPFLPLTTEIRIESTRDNRRIPYDICLPSSTNRDLFSSNNQMSPTHGFSLDQQAAKAVLLKDSLGLVVVLRLRTFFFSEAVQKYAR